MAKNVTIRGAGSIDVSDLYEQQLGAARTIPADPMASRPRRVEPEPS